MNSFQHVQCRWTNREIISVLYFICNNGTTLVLLYTDLLITNSEFKTALYGRMPGMPLPHGDIRTLFVSLTTSFGVHARNLTLYNPAHHFITLCHTGLACHFYRATACNATHGIAVGILSVRPSVRLSVRCVYCEKTKQRTANILIPHETAITLVFWQQQWLVGDAPFPLKSALKVTHPLQKRRLRES